MTRIQRIIVHLPVIAFLIRKSKLCIVPGFRGLPLYDVILFFVKQINRVGLNERAAAISFNLIMALPATLLFLFSLIPYLPESAKLELQILMLFKDIAPNSDTYNFIKEILDGLLNKHVGLFSFGFLLLMFYASNAMMGIIRTFDKSIEENKGFFLHRRMRAIRLTIMLIILVIISTFLLLVGKTQLTFLLKQVFNLKRSERVLWWNSIRWLIIIALLFYGIAFIYKFAPSVKKRWDFLFPGSILSTLLTMFSTVLFSYWVNNFAAYNKVYGSIGTVLIIMVLIYYNSLILLIGFELNVSITYLTQEAHNRKINEQKEQIGHS